MKIYRGIRHEQAGVEVFVNGNRLLLEPSLKLRNHSPTGFEWGYGGSGPSQLALAILLDCFGQEKAEAMYQEFKARVVCTLPHGEWTLTDAQISAVCLDIARERPGLCHLENAALGHCSCYRDCDVDALSGTWHQHPEEPCPVHPDAPIGRR